ncbi:phage tail tape measure protein [Virgibacillus salarius]|uniref:phage tail tape measure protein n=1 Tax=Virgibacillus salarius TaxID=447199 RepID=UPI002491FB24|nr:phage tail tape measure protein [Virgibacillus salarius]WBX80121.1 phage tail tape measure protein [Virgibacillus salarius]
MAKNPETKVKFSIFNKEFNDGINEMNKESTSLRKEFKLQSEQMKQTGTAAEKLEARISYLGKEQDIVRRKIQTTEQQLDKAKQTYGENSNEANKLSNKLLDLRISEQKLENSINQSKNEIAKQAQEMQEASGDADKYKKSLQDISNEAGDLGDKLNTGVTLPIAGMGAVAGKSAMDVSDAVRLMNGALGATGEEAKQLEQDMRTVWSDGFGDNPEEIARAIMMVKQNIQGIDEGEELQKATKNILLLAEATESDLGEATRGVNQLMHNFGLTADEAMDLFKKGQEEGINYSNEMFDNIAEYAPLFKQMGFAADDYFTILANGTKNGAYNLDYINDLMKEFNIRAQDGSDKTADAFGEMSKATQKLFKEFENGEATTEDLFNAVIPELEDMEDHR